MSEVGSSIDESPTQAELRFFAALRDREECDLSDGAEISDTDMANWGDDRVIRSSAIDFALRQLSANDPQRPPGRLEVRGALISEPLYELLGAELIGFTFEACAFFDNVHFNNCTFFGNVTFKNCYFRTEVNFYESTFFQNVDLSGSRFEQPMSFTGCRFHESVVCNQVQATSLNFSRSTFSKTAWFDSLKVFGETAFYEAKFCDSAYFNGAIFSGDISLFKSEIDGSLHFRDCTFIGDAHIGGCKCVDAWFIACNFLRKASFSGTSFSEPAFFAYDIFYGETNFNGVSFGEKATFYCLTFLDSAKFYAASFESSVSFENSVAKEWDLSEVAFNAGDIGPIVGLGVILKKVILATRGRLVVAAPSIVATWLTVQHGIHMVFRADSVDLSDSEFAKKSILSSYGVEELKELRDEPISDDSSLNSDSGPEETSNERVQALREAEKFRADVFRAINSLPLKCAVSSLERANVVELALTAVTLSHCHFAGAHGLDKIRIGSNCAFLLTPNWWRWKRFTPRRMYTRRRILFEEVGWRRANGATYPLSPLDVSTIYRDLRKSLEDAKNEPAAADFYYGEMEMRRLSGKSFSALTGRVERGTPFVERMLLAAYWALSGYGLRASRALLALTFLVLIAASTFTHEEFATVSPPQPQITSVDLSSGAVHLTSAPPQVKPSFSMALEHAARQSFSILQPKSADSEIVTHGFGTLLDFLLRFAGPALVALAVLAVRGRTKR